ncbi:restriction endonuclease subunit S [Paracidovorax avenae]|uniref:restriction endonuclease subunit S n=1 Tax=Paracidovorax avenae TaxID=80867 RepID=UPI000D20AEF1|nr:restriction endonuclease subunit S [Paracidovorax avenae]AVT11450.1 restriction endonuclease subunit S [Paracidovorax avenae]
MRAWPVVPLADVLQHRKEFITIDDTQHYKRCRVQLHAKGVLLRDSVYGADIKTKKQQVCRAGEFLVAEIDAKMGGFGLVPTALDGAVVSSHYFLFKLDESCLDARYLDHYCRTERFRTQVEAQGSTNYAAIRPADVLAYTIPLPPLAAQQALVVRLDALAKKTRQVEAHLDAVERISSSLLLSLHHKLANDRRVKLGDVLELQERSEAIASTGSYPQVGIRGFGGGLFPKASVGGTETSYKAFNRLYEGAIVLSQVKGWEGAIARCPKELDGWFVSPEYRTFHCKPNLASDEYFGELVRTEWFWSQLQDATRGVGARRERTRPEQFLNIELPMPRIDDQLRIVEILKRQGPLKVKHTAIREASAALLPATLERLFSTGMIAHV